jgi:hypothetical protein
VSSAWLFLNINKQVIFNMTVFLTDDTRRHFDTAFGIQTKTIIFESQK